MTDATWDRRELPLLRAIANHDEDKSPPTSDALAAELPELSPRAIEVALDALVDDGHLTATPLNHEGRVAFINIRLTGHGRRAVGQWPSGEAYDAFIARLDSRLDATSDADERSRLERLRNAVLDVGRDVLGIVIADVIRGR